MNGGLMNYYHNAFEQLFCWKPKEAEISGDF